jgi:hypothetical protein
MMLSIPDALAFPAAAAYFSLTMNTHAVWRWLLILAAIPAGWTIGDVVVWRVGLTVLSVNQIGEPYEHLRAVLILSVLGAALGGVLAAGAAWHFTRPVQNEEVV